jgi:hypothetical protein
MVVTRLHHAGCARSPLSRLAAAQDSPRAKRGHLVHRAVGEYHRRELRRFTSGQTELDSPAEELPVAMPCGRKQPSPVMPGSSFSCAIPAFVGRRRFDRRSYLRC